MKIIGISGPARSGKDTLGDNFLEILQEWGIKCNKQSFANQLRIETDDFLQKTLGISAFTQKDEEKNIIRPFLVTWGTHVRRKLDPDIWIKSVEKSLTDDSVTIISDVRFENEFQWIKDMGGYCVFVDRYTPQGKLVPAANQDEEEHTMKLRAKCDHSFAWDTISNDQWLVAIAYEVLLKTVPEKELEKWTQTYH